MIDFASLGEPLVLTAEQEHEAWRSGDMQTLIRAQIPVAVKVTKSVCKRLWYWDEELALSVALEHLCEKIHKCDGDKVQRLCSWSWRVMENRLRDFIRKEKKIASAASSTFEEPSQEPRLTDGESSYQDELAAVRGAIAKLPPEKRAIMEGGLKGLSFIKVAKLIGITRGRAAHLRREAIKDIQDLLSIERKEVVMAKKGTSKGGKGGKGC